MGGRLDGNFLPGSLPHKFILFVTLIICFAVNNFFSLSQFGGCERALSYATAPVNGGQCSPVCVSSLSHLCDYRPGATVSCNNTGDHSRVTEQQWNRPPASYSNCQIETSPTCISRHSASLVLLRSRAVFMLDWSVLLTTRKLTTLLAISTNERSIPEVCISYIGTATAEPSAHCIGA